LAHRIKNRGHHVILVDYQPTSENMVIDFAQRIMVDYQQILNFSLKLQETVRLLLNGTPAIICNSKFILASCN
jgi:hypothetical protein